MRWWFIVAFCVLVRPGRAETVLHVSLDGNDGWSGALAEPNAAGDDGPVRSLARAVELTRAGNGNATIVVHGGTYYLPAPIVLGPADSGLRIAAAAGEQPVLSGGRAITGWRPYRDGILQADLSALDLPDVNFRELYYNGRRQPLARVPNLVPEHPRIGGFLANAAVVEPDTKTKFCYRPGELDPTRWTHPERAIMVFHDKLNYETQWSEVKSVDPDRRVIEVARGVYGLEVGCPYYLCNVFEELDAPGEWCVDPDTKTLYFMPPSDIQTATVTVPAIDSVVVIQGDAAAGQLVQNVRLEHLVVRDTRGDGIHITGATGCQVLGCAIRNVNHGVYLGLDTHDCRVAGCDITQTKIDGVSIQGDRLAHERVTGHVVDNNTIWDFGYGRIHNRCGGVWLWGCRGVKVTHNHIHDGPRYAIGMDVGGDCEIAWNDCHDVNLETCDTGVIEAATAYHWGLPIEEQAERNKQQNSGNTIHHNLIHDSGGFGRRPDGTFGFPVYSWGVYLDTHCSYWRVYDNIIFRTVLGAFMVNGGRENVFENNICVDGQQYQLFLEPWPKFTIAGNRIERNVISYLARGSALYRLPSYDPGYYTFAANLIDPRGGPVSVSGPPGLRRRDAWTGWLALGQDAGSRLADPLFVDPERGDYRLRSGSPAVELGIHPVDLTEAGCYESSERCTWPPPDETMVREPADYRPLPDLAQQPPLRDYEAYALGERERGAHVGVGPGDVGVTDETAAKGRQSLKVTDGPGGKNAWEPYITYPLELDEGVLKAGFALRWESGALFVYEWRDDPYHYSLGPSLKVDADGWLMANGRRLLQLPASEWVRFDIVCGLGPQATGTYALTIGLPGAEPRVFTDLPHAEGFETLACVVVMSMTDGPSTFYLDNVTFEAVAEPK